MIFVAGILGSSLPKLGVRFLKSKHRDAELHLAGDGRLLIYLLTYSRERSPS